MSGECHEKNEVDTTIAEIIFSLRERYKSINLVNVRPLHFEAGWTDSWSHRRCLHEHSTLLEAAQCASPHGAGWYVFAVEASEPRQLDGSEEALVNDYRFGKDRSAAH